MKAINSPSHTASVSCVAIKSPSQAKGIFVLSMLACLSCLLLSLTAKAGIPIEQAQRDFQVRYHLLESGGDINNTNFLVWPACGDGNGATPNYPKDGYYGDLDQNPNLEVQLVQDLVFKFYSNNIIYSSFVKATNLEDLNGVSAISNYTSMDMPFISTNDVTTNTYLDVFQTLKSNINALRYIQTTAQQTLTTGDSRFTVSYVSSTNDYCSGVKSCVEDNAANTPWGGGDVLEPTACDFISFTSCGMQYTDRTNFTNPDGAAVVASYQRPTGNYLLVADKDGRMDCWNVSASPYTNQSTLRPASGLSFYGSALDYSVTAGMWVAVLYDGTSSQVHLITLDSGTNLVDAASSTLPGSSKSFPCWVACNDTNGEAYLLTQTNLYAYDTIGQTLNSHISSETGNTIQQPFVVPTSNGRLVNVAVDDSSYFAPNEVLVVDIVEGGVNTFTYFQVSSISDSSHVSLVYLAHSLDGAGTTVPAGAYFEMSYVGDYFSVGKETTQLGYDRASDKIYVARQSGDFIGCLLDVFQGSNLTHLTTISVPSNPRFDDYTAYDIGYGGCVFNPLNGFVYVVADNQDTDGYVIPTIYVINPSNGSTVTTITLASGQDTENIAYDPIANQIWWDIYDDNSGDTLIYYLCCGDNTVNGSINTDAYDDFENPATFSVSLNEAFMPFGPTTHVFAIGNTNGCQPGSPIGSISEYYQNTDPTNTAATIYSGMLLNTRGEISCDLTKYTKGTASIFLKLAAPPVTASWNACSGIFGTISVTNSFVGNPSLATNEDTYGLWTNGTLTLGIISTTAEIVTNSDALQTFPSGCDGPDTLSGWVVSDAVVIVAPDFTTTPDHKCCSSSSCSACVAGGAGTQEAYIASIHFSVGLGNDNFGDSAGSVAIDADYPNLNLYSPSSLRFYLATNCYAIYDTDGVIRQLKSSQVLVDIVTNGATNYSMSFYTPNQFGTTNSNGIWSPTGTPYTTITVENPDDSLTVTNRLMIVNVTEGDTNVTVYTYSGNNQWSLSTGNGLRVETRASVWDPTSTVRTETLTISNINNQLVYEETNTYVQYPWGQEQVQNIIDPNGAALTSSWVFYTNATTDGGNYRQLKQQIDANGHWIFYQYDQYGRETNRVEQFLNESVGTSSDLNHQMITIYGTSDPQVTTIQYLLSTEIGRSYEIIHGSGFVQTIQCQYPGASWIDSSNLVTTTTMYTNGSFTRQLQSIQNPDGTVRLYAYSTNSSEKTTVVLSGQQDPSSSTNILPGGTITTTVVGLAGQILSNTVQYKSSSTSNITTSQDTYVYLDALNRSYTVSHLDGTSETYQYACCGLESYTDKDGVATEFYYDGLKRQIGTLRNGITVSNGLDALGNTLVTIRNPGLGQIVDQMMMYDLAGRVARATNALSGVTIYTNYFDSSHQLIKSTTNPDLGIIIQTYAQDGSLLTLAGSAVLPMFYEYGVDGDGTFTTQIKSNTITGSTNEWIKTSSDAVGRSYKTLFPSASGTHAAVSYYNGAGQLSKQVDADGVTKLFGYNGLGQLSLTAIDMDQDGTINTNATGIDRVTQTISDVAYDSTVVANVSRTRNYVWTDGNSTPLLSSVTETSVDGLRVWNLNYNNGTSMTSQSITVYASGGYRYLTNIAPDGSYWLSTYLNGQLVAVINNDANSSPIAGNSYAYDSFGRQKTATDARNGTTTFYFNNADQVSGIVSPAPATGESAQVTSNYFDNTGRITNSVLPDGTIITSEFYQTGLLKRTYGSRTYPVGYGYDDQGRMIKMTNWSSFAPASQSGSRITTWNYDAYTGLLDSKTYDGGLSGSSYTYTPAQRLASRTWARGIVTSNFYDNAGGIQAVTHYDSITPNLTYGYDRRGRQTNITQTFKDSTTAVCKLAYNDLNEELSETYTGGPLDGLSITNGYDNLLRHTNLVVIGSGLLTSTRYNYDAASRLQTVSDGTNSATYSYVVNSMLVSNIVFQQSGSTRMTTTKQYDFLNRLTYIGSTNTSGTVLDSHGYAYNNANQRTSVTNADGTYWVYSYDSLGQVISGIKHWSDGTVVAGQQFGYAFDDIGNRTSTSAGGDQWGANLRYSTYGANTLNQYSNRTVVGAFDVIGTATNTATVTVNNQPTYREGNYYRAQISVNNSTAPVWQSVTNMAVLNQGTNQDIIATNNGNIYLTQNPEKFAYDADGNLTNDGRWTYFWDGENRLICMSNNANVPDAAKMILNFSYDYMGRRTNKKVSQYNGSGYSLATQATFAYYGWNLIAELNGAGLVRSYQWGTDISGSDQEAGGVGGLLEVTFYGTQADSGFASYDSNGNIVGLFNTADGTPLATYEYGSFGEPIRADGLLAKNNPFRFSTKYQDDETDLYYYGSRYYSANLARWLNRDVIEEAGGLNLYVFCGNDANNSSDLLGFVWDIERKAKDRAHVKPAKGDTVASLASQVHLSVSDYKNWLKPVGPSKIPDSANTPINECSEFTIPNTVFIDVGYRFQSPEKWYDLGVWILKAYDHSINPNFWDVQSAAYFASFPFKGMGFNVEMEIGASAGDIRSHLSSPNIAAYIFAGHGANGDINTPQSDDFVQAGVYTPYGISYMWLIACETAKKKDIWIQNVAESGTFIGYSDKINFLNRDDYKITLKGTSK